MTAPPGARSHPSTATRLKELAGPELYRRNAFRRTGLPAVAALSDIKNRRRTVNTCIELDIEIDVPGEFPPREPLTADQARAAFEDLTDSQRRIVDEVFWFWGTDCSGCLCPESVHRNHDDAVRAHVRALDAELSDPGQPPDTEAARQRNEEWAEAASQWRLLLRRAPFWEHLRTRLQALDDRRLDESVIDLLRGAVPRTLVAPVVHLAVADGAPERLVQQCLKWSDVGRHALDDALDDILSPRYAALSPHIQRAHEHTVAGRPSAAESLLLEHVVPALERLEPFEGRTSTHRAAARRRTDAVRDATAVQLANSAYKTLELGQVTALSPGWAVGRLERARRFATRPDTQEGIDQALSLVRAARSAGLGLGLGTGPGMRSTPPGARSRPRPAPPPATRRPASPGPRPQPGRPRSATPARPRRDLPSALTVVTVLTGVIVFVVLMSLSVSAPLPYALFAMGAVQLIGGGIRTFRDRRPTDRPLGRR
ncbi:hypothetical protein ACFYZ3_22450 [Streptomyces sp. NPDC001599]|uniref:hypothetical protein n=1 Tax=Streptomyces sp. NPDC001599 TaxID=3364591 RepID=UPI00369FFB50